MGLRLQLYIATAHCQDIKHVGNPIHYNHHRLNQERCFKQQLHDQTACAMKVDGIKILEGLAASGLRSIRYALEVDGTGRVDANDLDSDAVEAMKRNIQYNGPEAEQRMRPLQGDARVIMLQSPLVGPLTAGDCT